MEHEIVTFLRGAAMMALFGIAVFFLRSWRMTRDRLFALFAIAFFMLAVSQIAVLLLDESGEFMPIAYWIRLVAFGFIIFGIALKNLPAKGAKK